MIRVLVIVFVNAMFLASAYPDTTVHIQKHEGPIYVSPDRCDNPVTIGNPINIGNRHPGNQSPLYHQTCETDCKCVTKHINTCVPINIVPQNTCTPGTYYSCPNYGCPNYGCPDYNSGCPDYGYRYEGRDGCPIASDGLIPLLKSYLGQSKCPKHGCQCGQSYVTY